MEQMDDKQRLMLSKLIKENNVTDQTPLIRELKHSELILADVDRMVAVLAKYPQPLLPRSELLNDARAECADVANWLYCNYTDIFVRVLKGNMDMQMLRQVIALLKQIEDGELNQHEASFQLGSLLKKLYVDSAVKQVEKNDADANMSAAAAPKKEYVKSNLTWDDFKKQHRLR